MNIPYFICSSVDEHLGYFHPLTTVNNARVNMGVQISLSLSFCFQFFWVYSQK